MKLIVIMTFTLLSACQEKPLESPPTANKKQCEEKSWIENGPKVFLCMDDKAGCYVLVSSTGNSISCMRKRIDSPAPYVAAKVTETLKPIAESTYQDYSYRPKKDLIKVDEDEEENTEKH